MPMTTTEEKIAENKEDLREILLELKKRTEEIVITFIFNRKNRDQPDADDDGIEPYQHPVFSFKNIGFILVHSILSDGTFNN